jgi:predicted HTH transcriptional regulator
MDKKRIFISSVQREFAQERERLCNYIRQDALLGKYFLPFIFEELHESFPNNPLIANPLYLAGYAERLGTGTADIIKQCLAIGLKPPTFAQTEHFRVTFWRNHETLNENPATLNENPATLKPLQGLPRRMTRETLEKIILMLCSNEYLTVNQISKLTGRSSEYLLNEIMPSLLSNEKLVRLFPATPKHKNQAYKTNHNK